MRIKFAIIVSMLLTNVSFAYEIQNNPDKRMSIGISYNRNHLNGDYELKSISLSDYGTLIQNTYGGDLRFPIASFLTFSVGGGYTTTSLGLGVLDKDERWNMKGYNLNAGIRVYIP